MNITVDTIIGLVALISTFGIYFLDVRHKLDTLIERQEGILSKSQANDLADLYLDAVQCHLNLALSHYAGNDLPKHYRDGHLKEIMLEFHKAYDRIVKMSVRPMVKSFRLRGNHRFEDIISRISQESNSQAFDSIRKTISAASISKQSVEDLLPDIQLALGEANEKGRKLIRKEIELLYPRSSDS